LRRRFTISSWSFSFPLASAANTVGHWAIAAPDRASWLLTWATLTIATAMISLFAVLTVRMLSRTSREQRARSAPGTKPQPPTLGHRTMGVPTSTIRYLGPSRIPLARGSSSTRESSHAHTAHLAAPERDAPQRCAPSGPPPAVPNGRPVLRH